MELAGHVVRKGSSTKCKEEEKRSHLADMLVARTKILKRIFEKQCTVSQPDPLGGLLRGTSSSPPEYPMLKKILYLQWPART
jgi:hypothetical protein